MHLLELGFSISGKLAIARYQFAITPPNENETTFRYILQLTEDIGLAIIKRC
jgi:hypothetical protein